MSNYEVINNGDGTVTINEDYFEELLNDSSFLSILEAYGVDNWDGYGYAKEEFYQDEEE